MKGDARQGVLVALTLSALVGGLAITLLPERAREVDTPAVAGTGQPDRSDAAKAPSGDAAELHQRFQQAAAMLHAGQYDYALAALERVLEIAPGLPEAHVNAGFALLELGRPERAEQHFQTAIDLRAAQVNAYYGLALAREAAGDLDSALGAMRTYVHLSPRDDPHLRRAQAAIWEWETRRDEHPGRAPAPQGDAVEAPGEVSS